MTASRTPFRYSPGLVAIHWISAGLIAVAALLAWTAGWFDDEKFVIGLHRSLGLVALVLVTLRIAHKRREPAVPEWEDSPWRRRAARAAHLALYALLVAVPLLGWLQTSASGKPFMFFDVLRIPALIARDRDLAGQLQEAHEVAAFSLVGLIGLHIAAALWHRLVRRDGVLYAMLPLKRLLPTAAPAVPVVIPVPVSRNTDVSRHSVVATEGN